jgi:hypothetical protein
MGDRVGWGPATAEVSGVKAGEFAVGAQAASKQTSKKIAKGFIGFSLMRHYIRVRL